ncbi:hypothetical protein OIU76_003106 [Salix suchowensis]|nr:hypothetical protein OIU76_003106 [Salix suchowensis]
MISLGSVLRSTRHANMQDLQVWPRFLSQVAGDGVTKVSEQFPGVMNFPGKSHHAWDLKFEAVKVRLQENEEQLGFKGQQQLGLRVHGGVASS